ncbi:MULTISPECIES: creatininase family protein [unclassified Roseitalea]|uniref:creatininase family protein n=1 Tax=unclassified Roseitalea TaxID=2639107 RepID=UPI00273DFD71|nr:MULTISPECIES: creatininase family protein [unclassified Roseitalea]
MTRRLWWGDFTARQFEDLDPEATVAVLPVAAIEQHGPHLPVSTDQSIMEGMLATVFALLPDDLDARFLPVQPVGKSNEHVRVPGTLTVDARTLIAHWCDLGDSVARAGIRKLVIVNSHGGNEEIMGIVAREMRVRHDMLAIKTSWMRFGLPEGLYSDTERQFGIHGGDVETSLMLHFRPETVAMEKAEDFSSRTVDARATFDHIAPQGTHAWAWIASDLNPQGVVGEAGRATAQKGEATARHQAEGFVELLKQVRRARLADWLGG